MGYAFDLEACLQHHMLHTHHSEVKLNDYYICSSFEKEGECEDDKWS